MRPTVLFNTELIHAGDYYDFFAKIATKSEFFKKKFCKFKNS